MSLNKKEIKEVCKILHIDFIKCLKCGSSSGFEIYKINDDIVKDVFQFDCCSDFINKIRVYPGAAVANHSLENFTNLQTSYYYIGWTKATAYNVDGNFYRMPGYIHLDKFIKMQNFQ